MTTTFLHTADWQLGKPFAGVDDDHNRVLLQQERINVLKRIAAAARDNSASFILVAGDLFDSPTPTKATVSAACSAIGAMKIPVYAIPGNHDHGGPGSLWEQEFFRREREQLAPNLRLLMKATPIPLDDAVVFPCPLLRRHEATDPTAWLRGSDLDLGMFGERPRIVLAHGSVQGFTNLEPDEEEAGGGLPNQIDLSRLPGDAFDYVALGDWHGAKEISPKAWYSGTPELDRFPKGSDHNPGNVLRVTARRGAVAEVRPLATARFRWHTLECQFADDSAVARLEERFNDLVAARAGEDLLRLHLGGALGIKATTGLEANLEAWKARLLRLKLSDETIIAPSQAETEALRDRPGDPLISRVAAKLLAMAQGSGEDADLARVALRELYAACNTR